jgi:hypothetical protein
MTPSHPVELGGETLELRFDFRAIAGVESETGQPFVRLARSLAALDLGLREVECLYRHALGKAAPKDLGDRLVALGITGAMELLTPAVAASFVGGKAAAEGGDTPSEGPTRSGTSSG